MLLMILLLIGNVIFDFNLEFVLQFHRDIKGHVLIKTPSRSSCLPEKVIKKSVILFEAH